ncbi:MAG: DUF547 domain-containing protein [Myxococcota bacterium]
MRLSNVRPNLKPWVFWPLILVGLAWALYEVLGFQVIDAEASAPPDYDTTALASILDTTLNPRGVDYDALDVALLRRQAAIFDVFGPTQTPDRFANDDARLAYYLNAYNTLVLLGVVTHLPIGSVHDVRGPVEPKSGFGFFYALRFRVDGGTTNLYDLEDDEIRGFGDARIHAAINCASASCPSLFPEPFDPDRLDEQLDEAMRRMVNDTDHVRVDPDREVIEISSIFDWYREDFETHARTRDFGETTLDFIAYYLDGEGRARFETARDANWPVRFAEYDWSLNRASPQSEN